MTIEISAPARGQAIESIERYFRENMDEPIGQLGAGALLDFFLQELGPIAYNQAVADMQARLQAKLADIGGEVYEDEFQYWLSAKRRKK